jgi:hypothetical protein
VALGSDYYRHWCLRVSPVFVGALSASSTRSLERFRSSLWLVARRCDHESRATSLSLQTIWMMLLARSPMAA